MFVKFVSFVPIKKAKNYTNYTNSKARRISCVRRMKNEKMANDK